MSYLTVAPFSGLGFWLLQFLFTSVHSLLRRMGSIPRVRNGIMIAASGAVVILSQLEHHGLALFVMLVGASSLVYVVGKGLSGSASPNLRRTISVAVIAGVVLFLCFFKYVYFQELLTSLLMGPTHASSDTPTTARQPLIFLGVSYFTFKFISFIADSYNRKIKNYDYLTFVNYILFFPSFFGGPINRYGPFAGNLLAPGDFLSLSNVTDGLKRIVNGLFKKTAANLLIPYSIASLDFADPALTSAQAIVGIYTYMLFIYLDFSGYTDLAIGSGKLVGIDLPENFNWPFFKRNLQQFWANWHMSLTAWLTDYIYWPLARKFRHLEALRKRPVSNSAVCIIITFVVCGLWHGDGLNFLIWGTYHGIGLALLNGYNHWEKKHAPVGWRKFMNTSNIARVGSTFITIQYVAFGFLLFGCDMQKLGTFFALFVKS